MSEIFQFPNERASPGDTFRCRKCRVYLFCFDNLGPFHKKIEPVDQCSAWYIDSDEMDGNEDGTLVWIRQAVDESQWTEGKLYCPKCSSRIGSFNFTQGVRCSCFTFIIPAIWIQKCKVDQITISDSKPNIRLPDKPDNNRDGGNSNEGGSSMYYMETSQTGFQCSQTCSDRSPSGSKTNISGSQTGSQSSQTCSDRSPSGSKTNISCSQTGSQSSQTCSDRSPSGSKTTVSGSQTKVDMGQNASMVDCEMIYLCECNREESSETSNKELKMVPRQKRFIKCIGHCEQSTHDFENNFDQNVSDKQTRNFASSIPESQSGISDTDLNHTVGSNRIHRRKIHRQTPNDVMLHGESFSTHEHAKGTSSGHTCMEAFTTKREDGSRFQLLEEVEHEFEDVIKTAAVFEENKPQVEDIPDQVTCPVCLDLLYDPLVCPCRHVYCDSCLRILNSKSRHSVPRCPLCRKSIYYVYPAIEMREEIKKCYPIAYKARHKSERRAPHRRLPLPNGRMKPRQKESTRVPDLAMPYSVLVVLGCVLACCGLCLLILFMFCPPTQNRCITVIGYEWMNGY